MLTIHQSNRLEILAARLAELLREPVVPDALVPEIVVVQNTGMKRWLSMELASALGICAGIDFRLPAELAWDAFRRVLDGVPPRSGVDPEIATWALMGILERLERDERFRPVHAYLAPDAAGSVATVATDAARSTGTSRAPGAARAAGATDVAGAPRAAQTTVATRDDVRRFDLARRLADTFSQYLFFRPDWIRAWERGERGTRKPDSAFDEAWQAELWRRLVAQTGARRHFASLEEELRRRLFQPRLDDLARLPRRVFLFGIPALPPSILDVFAALGWQREVHVFLLNPSRAYWFDILSARDQARAERRAGPLDPSDLHHERGNSLLASLGKQSRDFIGSLLARDDGHVRHEERFSDPLAEPPCEAGAATLLRGLQADMLELRERGGSAPGTSPDADLFPPAAAIAASDRSVQVHVCHGAMREVEVLHDQLLALFAENPQLEPSDVIVMTPDIDTYAPCIGAHFSTVPAQRRIPFSIADVSLSAESPLVAGFLSLLDLPGSRYEASAVLDLLELPAVQRKFGLDAQQVERIQRWVREVGIRWSIDGATKAALGVPPTHEHTWRFGLDRLLLGYALPGDGRTLFRGILPHDEVEGDQALALGRLASLTELLFSLDRELAAPRPLDAWKVNLRVLLERVFTASDDEESQMHPIREALDGLATAAEAAGFPGPVSLDVVKLHLRRRLSAPAGSGRFLAGQVTFCAMVPMRSIPFQVVCLIGMNDRSFPRSRRPDGFDLIALEPRHGDRSRREDDRYLFLEALLSARRCLYLSYVGRGIRDNAAIPPSVLVSELLDAISRGFATWGDEACSPAERAERVRRHVVTEHPLQASSPRYFRGDAKLFSYARELCAATARAMAQPAEPTLLVQNPPLQPAEAEESTVDIDRLVDFLGNPARGFAQRRMGIFLEEAEGLIEPSEPFALDDLAQFLMCDELVERQLGGSSPAELLALAQARGVLPHGPIGEAAFAEVARGAREFAARFTGLCGGSAIRDIPLVGLEVARLVIEGRLRGLTPNGLVRGRPATVKARDLLSAWICHLAFCALAPGGGLPPGLPRVTTYLGRDELIRFGEVGDAALQLDAIVEAYREGLAGPLPLFPRSSFAYARALPRGREAALVAARIAWIGDGWTPGEHEGPYARLLYRDTDPLTAEFEEVAARIITPIVEREKLG